MARLRKRMFGSGAVVAVVVLVVAACGGGDPTATPRPTATTQPVATEAPKAAPDFPNARFGGTLKFATGGDPPSWDGLRESTGQTHDPLMPNYDQLVMFDPNNLDEIVGQVAESWTVSDDGLRWIFTIRRGITFSNGNPLTAQDVAFTYDLIQNPPEDIPSPWIGNLARVGDITTPDDYTLSLTLTSVDASLLASLAAGPLLIHDKEFVEAEGRERVAQWPPMGSGPFMGEPDGFNRGVSVELVRRGDYWVEGRPYMDSIKVFIVPDRGTTFANFLTGQLNFGLALNPSEASEARSTLGNRVTLQETSSDVWWSIAMNIRNAPFNDIRVREAVALGLDKHGYIEAVNQGLGVVAGYIPPGTGFDLSESELLKISGYSPDRAANIARAKELLADAGFPNGFETTFLVRNIGVYVDSNVFMQANMADIGITGDLELQDSAQFFDSLFNTDEPRWSLAARAHRTPFPDPNGAYVAFHLCGGGRNLTGLCDNTLEELFAAQNLVATDPAKRKQLVQEMESYALGLYHEPVAAYNQAIYAKYSFVTNHTFPVFYKTNRQFRDMWLEE